MSNIHIHNVMSSGGGGRSSGVENAGSLCFDPRLLFPIPESNNSAPSDATQPAAPSSSSSSSSPDSFDAHAFVSSILERGRVDGNSGGVGMIMGMGMGMGGVPLSTLRDDLTHTQLNLKQRLIDLLNREYTAFIGLSSSLQGVDTKVEESKEEVKQLRASVEQLLLQVGGGQSKGDAGVQTQTAAGLVAVESLIAHERTEVKQREIVVHMLMHITQQMKVIDSMVRENDESEEERRKESMEKTSNHHQPANRTSSSHAFLPTSLSSIPPSHARIVQQHLELSALKKESVGETVQRHHDAGDAPVDEWDEDSFDDSHTLLDDGEDDDDTCTYGGVRLDIPRWMMQQHTGGAADGVISVRSHREEWDDDQAEQVELHTTASAPSTLDPNPSFTLYQSLLSTPTPSSECNADSHDARLPALSSTLIRLERAAHSLSSLSALLPLCSHFHLARDLTRSDGSGTFDRLQTRVGKQLEECFTLILQRMATQVDERLRQKDEEGWKEMGQQTDDASLSFPSIIYGLVRLALRAFTFLDSQTIAEELVRVHLVRPLLRKHMQPSMLRYPHSAGHDSTSVTTPTSPSASNLNQTASDEDAYWSMRDKQKEEGQLSPLEIIYEKIIFMVRGPIRLLIDCCHTNYTLAETDASPYQSSTIVSPLTSFSFLPSSFFAEFSSHCSSTSELATLLFSPGRPHIFLDHYRITQRFLRNVEEEAEAVKADGHNSGLQQSLHVHPSWNAFAQHWKLTVYFALRLQSIAAPLELAMHQATVAQGEAMIDAYAKSEKSDHDMAVEPLPQSSIPTVLSFSDLTPLASVLHLPPSRSLWLSLCECFSPRRFLQPLASRFIQLALQSIARHANLAQQLTQVGQQTPSSASQDKISSSSNPPHTICMLLLLNSDLHRLQQFLLSYRLVPFVATALGLSTDVVHTQLPRALRSILPSDPAGVSPAAPTNSSSSEVATISLLSSAFAPSFKRYHSLSITIDERLSSLILARCRRPLQSVSRIATVYRGTRRKVPARPFRYVRAALQPLLTIIRAVDTGRIAPVLQTAREEAAVHVEMEANEWMGEDDVKDETLPPSSGYDSSYALLPLPSRHALVHSVLHPFVSDFSTRMRECLADVARFDDLSKKLGKRTTAAHSGSADATDSEKTRRQLEMDAAHIIHLIRTQIQPPHPNTEDILTPLRQ